METRLRTACWLAIVSLGAASAASASPLTASTTASLSGNTASASQAGAAASAPSSSVQSVTFSFTNTSDRPIERIPAIHARNQNQGPDLVLFGPRNTVSVLSLVAPIAPGATTTIQLPISQVQGATGYSLIGMEPPAAASSPLVQGGSAQRGQLVLALPPSVSTPGQAFKDLFSGFSSPDILTGARRRERVLGSDFLGRLFGRKRDVLNRFLTGGQGLVRDEIPLDLSQHGAVSPGQLVVFAPTSEVVGSVQAVANPEPATILVWGVLALAGAPAAYRRFRGSHDKRRITG